MNTELSQLTFDKLRDFASRRRVLIAVRGLCVGVMALLIVMSAIAAADAIFIIKSQALRWVLSLTGYTLVALVVWLTCLRSLLRIPGSRELARLIEQAAPGLREDLTSAVELGAPQSDPRYDSPVFRALLQASVERRMSNVRVAALLPGGLIRGAALGATATLICCIALLLVPDLKFASRLTRALLPSAPVDRVSRVQVHIIAPNPADALAPHNDAVSVVVELTGGEAEDVIVETFRGDASVEDETLALKPAGGARRYAGVIQVGRDDVRYRVLAGDAVTRTFTIRTGARPHPVAFRKTYQYPPYASIDPRKVDEKHGHLEAIEGTTVELIIDSDQPVASGELRFEEAAGAKEKIAPIALVKLGDRQWRAEVPIKHSTLYKVHLVAGETGFENAFDPPYEIKAIPDLPPVIAVESPAKDMLSPPGEGVGVKLSASDDLGLAAVSQWVRVNGGEWSQVTLAGKPGRAWSDDRQWELYDLNLRAGDQVSTRFAAVDGAGNKTESSPVHITIAAGGLSTERMAGIEAKRRVLAALTALRTTADESTKTVAAVADRLPRAAELERRQLLQDAAMASRKLRDEADVCAAAIRSALKSNPAGSSAAELVALAARVAFVGDELATLAIAETELASIGNGALPTARHARAATFCLQAEASFKQFLVSDEADALLRDLLALAREQAGIAPHRSPDEPTAWQRLARRQLLVVSQVKQFEAMAAVMTPPDAAHLAVIAGAVKVLADARTETDKALAKPGKAAVMAQSERMRRALDGAVAALLPATRALARAATKERAAFAGADLDVTATLNPLLDSTRPAVMQANDPYWPALHRRLKSVGAAHEARSDADAVFVADLGLLRRAMTAIEARLKTEATDTVRARVDRVASALRVLETGHGVAEAHSTAAAMVSREKWHRDEAEAVTLHAREWSWLGVRIAKAQALVGLAGMPEEAVATVAAMGRSGPVVVIDTEMESRRMKGRVSQRRGGQFEQIASKLDEVKKLIAADMARARAVIAAEAPTLPQMMVAAAVAARKLEAKAVEHAEAQATPAEMKALAAAQQARDEKLDEIAEALRQDANAQDMMTEEGRDRARDADDATAMVREPAAKAAEAIKQAAAAADENQQRERLKDAAAQENRLAKALDKLVEHYEKLAEGKPEETRSALREAERDLGIKRELDAQFGRMERLAELANKPAAEQLAELENELKQNEAMKAELSDIAKEAAASAKESLEEAAEQERRVAQDLAAAAKAAKQAQPDVAGRMRELSRKANELSGKTPAIAQSAKKGTADDAAKSAAEAGKSLAKAGQVEPPENARDQEAAAKQAKALADALREANEKLKTAERQAADAADRLRKEEGDATAKLAIGNATNEERLKGAETMLHAKPRQDASRRAAAEAHAAAAKAADLAAEAEKLAAEAGKAAGAGDEAIKEGLRQQPAIAEAVKDAGEQVDRAARHEKRLENMRGAEALDRVKDGIQKDGAKEVNRAADQLARADDPAQAKPAVESAAQAIARQAEKLEQTLKNDRARGKAPGNAKSPAASGEAAAKDEEAAKWMARALDELDQANREAKEGPALALSPQAEKRLSPDGGMPAPGPANGEKDGEGSPGDGGSPSKEPGAGQGSKPPPGSPSASGGEASQAVREAAEAQRNAMAQARQQQGGPAAGGAMASKRPGGQPKNGPKGEGGEAPGGEGDAGKMAGGEGGKSGEGKGTSATGNRGSAKETGDLPEAVAGGTGEWGKLPARLAREMMEGQRDEVPAEYRSQVEAYFKAIAQKAKAK